jgi:hypothetical protein
MSKKIDREKWVSCDTCKEKFNCLSGNSKTLVVGGIEDSPAHACGICEYGDFGYADRKGGYCAKREVFINWWGTCPEWRAKSKNPHKFSYQAVNQFIYGRNVCYNQEARERLKAKRAKE